MKVQCLALVSLFASATAFAPAAFVARPQSFLANTASEDAVAAATAATEKFGATSQEARAAWDIVEEIDASTRYVLRIFFSPSVCLA